MAPDRQKIESLICFDFRLENKKCNLNSIYNMKISLLLSFILVCFQLTFAQFIPSNQKNFGGSANDEMYRFFNPNDLSYSYLIGRSYSGISGDKTEASYGGADIWIVKLDVNGTIVWDKTLGGMADDFFSSAVITDNSIYIGATSNSGISGNKTVSSNGSFDYWVIQLDHSGNITNQNSFGGTQTENLSEMKLINGELVFVGASLSGVGGNKTSANYGNNDVWIVRVNPADLSMNSQKNIGSPFEEGGKDIELIGSNYYVACVGDSGIGNDKTDAGFGLSDVWLLKLDANLNVLADKCYGGSDLDGAIDMCQLNNELYFTCMSFSNASGNKSQNNFGSIDAFPKYDAWTFKVDPTNLDLVWDMAYGGTQDESYPKIRALSNNQVIVSVSTRSAQNTGNITQPNYGLYDTKFIILNSNGSLLNEFTFGANLQDYVTVSGIFNNTIYFSGYSNSGISGNKTVGTNGQLDGWIGEVPLISLSLDEENLIALQIFPNPASEYFSLNATGTNQISPTEVKVVDSYGRVLRIFTFKTNEDLFYIGDLPNGTYFIQFNQGSSKLIKN